MSLAIEILFKPDMPLLIALEIKALVYPTLSTPLARVAKRMCPEAVSNAIF